MRKALHWIPTYNKSWAHRWEPHKNSHVLDTDLHRKHLLSTLTFSSNHLWLEIAVLLRTTVICHLQMVICWAKSECEQKIPTATQSQRFVKCRSIPKLGTEKLQKKRNIWHRNTIMFNTDVFWAFTYQPISTISKSSIGDHHDQVRHT